MTTNLIKYIKKSLYLYVFIGFVGLCIASAGSFEDFFKAAKTDDATTIRQLLAKGFDVNTTDPQGEYGLMIALRESSLKAAQALIEAPHADLNVLNSHGESPLMLAALAGHLDLVELLIKKGADVNKTGWTPLHYAASKSQLPILRVLIENHAYIDAESPNGSTPLMMAAMYGNPQTVELLLQEGADPLLKNQQGLTALQFAERASRAEAAALIAKPIRANRPPAQW